MLNDTITQNALCLTLNASPPQADIGHDAGSVQAQALTLIS
ncbi:MAG: hypothetical protein OEZ20_09080 [candidate division WOR-3 bacterium]|nr:hypothetical protein [candidate division WOR-3 bacterium]MDH5684602.1 hypothetical protein [candidate division WOR-3 bacterium]